MCRKDLTLFIGFWAESISWHFCVKLGGHDRVPSVGRVGGNSFFHFFISS